MVRSAIYIPRTDTDTVSAELIEIIGGPRVGTITEALRQSGVVVSAELLRASFGDLLAPYSAAQITKALGVLAEIPTPEQVERIATAEGDDRHVSFRRDEYEVLREARTSRDLVIRQPEIADYDNSVTPLLERVTLVDRLRETRALTGFNRIFDQAGFSLADRQGLLRRHAPNHVGESWLPAYVVYGEGIFVALSEQRLGEWEQRPVVRERISRLATRFSSARAERHLGARAVEARFVLIHTLSHLIMNQLTFECGYSSASLRERLYVAEGDAPMAAFLVYTAAGDSEGTMGGLVRMGRPGFLEDVLSRAIAKAQWCSADPVCMEIGALGGQGPDSCNLSACHACCLRSRNCVRRVQSLAGSGASCGRPRRS